MLGFRGTGSLGAPRPAGFRALLDVGYRLLCSRSLMVAGSRLESRIVPIP